MTILQDFESEILSTKIIREENQKIYDNAFDKTVLFIKSQLKNKLNEEITLRMSYDRHHYRSNSRLGSIGLSFQDEVRSFHDLASMTISFNEEDGKIVYKDESSHSSGGHSDLEGRKKFMKRVESMSAIVELSIIFESDSSKLQEVLLNLSDKSKNKSKSDSNYNKACRQKEKYINDQKEKKLKNILKVADNNFSSNYVEKILEKMKIENDNYQEIIYVNFEIRNDKVIFKEKSLRFENYGRLSIFFEDKRISKKNLSKELETMLLIKNNFFNDLENLPFDLEIRGNKREGRYSELSIDEISEKLKPYLIAMDF